MAEQSPIAESEPERGAVSVPGSPRGRRWRFGILLLLGIAFAAGLVAAPGAPDEAHASHTTGALRVYAPFGGSWWVSSPSKFHDGCSPYTENYYDTYKFDDGSCYAASYGDWAIDFAGGSVGDNVYIDVEPGTIDGNYGLGIYRVVAGDISQWDQSANGKYQYFGIHVQTATGAWENFAWMLLGHIDNFSYPTPGTVIAGPTSGRITVAVGKVAPLGSWPVHIHQELYNYSYYARSYNWDGPTTDDDTALSGPCIRGGGSATACNTQSYGTDVIGYVGGNKPSFAQVNNPYFVEF